MARSSCQDDEPDVSWDSKERPFWGLNNPCGNHHDGAMSDNPPTLENLYWIQLGKVVVELDKMTDWIDGRIPIAARKAPKAWALGFHAFAHSLGRTEDEMKRESYCIKLPGVEDPISVADELGWANFMDELADKMALDPGYQCRKPPPVALVCTQKQASRFVNDGWQDAAILASQSEDVIRPNSGVAAASTMLAGVSLDSASALPTTSSQADDDGDDEDDEDDDRHLSALFGEGTLNSIRIPQVDRTEQPQDEDDGTGDAEDKETQAQIEDLMKSMQGHGLMDDVKHWPHACKFFRHDEKNFDQGTLLPGMRRRSRSYQMVDVYKTLYQFLSNVNNGLINASKPGLGKTGETWMVYATIALAFMSRAHYKEFPNAHRSLETGDDCALGHPHGLECYCIRDSMTRSICQRLKRQPHLVVSPASLTTQWCNTWSDWFLPTVESAVLGTISPLPLILISHIKDASQAFISRPMEVNGNKIEMPVLSATHFRPTLTVEGELPSLKHLQRIKKDYLHKAAGDRRIFRSEEGAKREIDNKATHTFLYHRAARSLGDGIAIREAGSGLIKVTTRKNGEDEDVKVARERMVLICGQEFIAGGGLDDRLVYCNPTISRSGIAGYNSIRLTCCFVPSTICYDEFTRAKGLATRTMATLRDLVDINQTDPRHRAKVMLLSGTPMPRGPQDLDAALPLISCDPELHTKIKRAKTAFSKAMKRRGTDAGPALDTTAADWKTIAIDLLGDCLFERQWGQEWIGGTIQDPRPRLREYEPKFPDTPPHLKKELDKAMVALHNFILEQLQAQGRSEKELSEAAKNRVVHSSAWRHLHLLDTCPGLAMLSKNLLRSTQNTVLYKRALEELPDEVYKAACEQLHLIDRVVRGNREEAVKHCLALTVYPAIAQVIAAWLRYKLGDGVKVVVIASDDPGGPSARSARIAKLKQEAESRSDRPIVVVSTYTLMATGIDGLQDFMSVIIKVGEPFTHALTEQSIARLHRSGQTRVVELYEILGCKGGVNERLYNSNKYKVNLGLGGGFFLHF